MARRIHAPALRQLLADRGLKADDLAKALRIDRSSAYRAIRGADPLSEERWGAIQAILATSPTTGAAVTVSPNSFVVYDPDQADPEPADYDAKPEPDPEPAEAEQAA